MLDDVVGPPTEIVAPFPRHAEQHGDHDRRERKREQPYEVALTIVAERSRPQRLALAHDLVVERSDRTRTKRVLQHSALPPVIGVVGRAEHTTGLLVHADAEAVAPLVGTHQHIEHVDMATDDMERRIVFRLGVDRAPLAQDAMTDRRFEIVGASEMRIVGDLLSRHLLPRAQ